MQNLQAAWARAPPAQQFEATMLWAAACMGYMYFGFMRAGEFTTSSSNDPSVILASDAAVDSHTNPSKLRILLQRAKMGPFGKVVVICVGRTNSAMCPVAALLGYLVVRPAGDNPLFIFRDGTPLKRDRFVKEVKAALALVHIDHQGYSGHSFRIGAAPMATQAGVPEHRVKMLGRWNSEAYQVYIRTPRESLATVSQAIAC